MKLAEPLRGRHVRLRTAEPEDAEFVLSLRLDPELGKYLKPTDPSVEHQRAWIAAKQTAPDDYHLIIEGLDGTPYGVIALYDIVGDTFCWGRWIIARQAPVQAALESMLLLYWFAFRDLGLREAHFPVQRENRRVIAYHEQLGAQRIGEDESYLHFRYTRDEFDRNQGIRNTLKAWGAR